jgi:hypothetical protein
VALCLRFRPAALPPGDSDAEAAVAAAGHVCELQLLLLPFAQVCALECWLGEKWDFVREICTCACVCMSGLQVRTQDGHRRYIAFRNAMGF